MRVFKSEVKEMRNDDEEKSAPPAQPREVEGRVVDAPRADESPRVAAPEQADRDR
jgi:hypothetical protein